MLLHELTETTIQHAHTLTLSLSHTHTYTHHAVAVQSTLDMQVQLRIRLAELEERLLETHHLNHTPEKGACEEGEVRWRCARNAYRQLMGEVSTARVGALGRRREGWKGERT